MEKEQNGVVARVATQGRFTEAERRALAQWSVGKSENEIKTRAAEQGTSRGSIYAWRRQYFPDASKAKITAGVRPPAERAAAYREAKASGNISAWAKAHGLKGSTVRDWGVKAGMAGTRAPTRTKGLSTDERRHRGPGSGDPLKAYSLKEKREILAYAAAHSTVGAARKYGASKNAILMWRRAEAAGRLTETKRGMRLGWRKNAEPDAELLEADHTDRVKAREKRDELAELRKEVLVLRANLALARGQGYMKWMDIEETLGMGRKR